MVLVRQIGEMWMKPGGRSMSFEATEDFAIERVAFSWRARFPIFGPLAIRVVDGYANGVGRLRVSSLGIPIQSQAGPETSIGEAMRYLAELAWAPHAIAANRELEWREVDASTVEVACPVGSAEAMVRWEFDASGNLVRATGLRPFREGNAWKLTRWGGDFGQYEDFSGTRIPSRGEEWWDLPGGRFIYWRGQITALELLAELRAV